MTFLQRSTSRKLLIQINLHPGNGEGGNPLQNGNRTRLCPQTTRPLCSISLPPSPSSSATSPSPAARSPTTTSTAASPPSTPRAAASPALSSTTSSASTSPTPKP